MYKIAKKFSILIIIAYISFELLSRISVYHISSYIILFVFFLYALAYWKNSWCYCKKIGIYVLAILIGYCCYETSKINNLTIEHLSKLLKNCLKSSDKLLKVAYKFQILPVIICLLIFLISCIATKITAKKIVNEEMTLFESRKEVYEKLKRLLSFDNKIFSIGLNARYGCGKTFIVNKIKKEIKNVLFVDINSISANIDNIEEYIISEISILLSECGIYLDKLSVLIDSINSIKFLNALEYKQSVTRNYDELKDELIRCGKNIVFVVDDLDRIYNPEIVYKIFNIFEKIKCNNLKVIYLYDFVCLSNIIPLYNKSKTKNMVETKKFISKYISQEITLNDPMLDELQLTNLKNIIECKKVIEEINCIENRLIKYKIPINFSSLTNYTPRDLEIISEQLNSLSGDIIKGFSECTIIETLIFKLFFTEEYETVKSKNEKIESFIDFYDSQVENINFQNLINDMRQQRTLVENKHAKKKIRYISIFLIFNPSIDDYKFDNIISFGAKSDEFNKCVLSL